MKKENSILLSLVIIGLVLILIGMMTVPLSSNPQFTLLNIGMNLLLIGGTMILINNGKFKFTSFYRFIYPAIALCIVGVLLKLQHWPTADIIICIGLSGLPIIYGAYMFKFSKYRSTTSWLKFVFVFSFFISKLCLLMHWSYADLFSYITFLTLIVLLWQWIVPQKQKRKLYI